MTLLDAHVHVWDTGALDYPWLGGETTLAQRYLPSNTDRAEGAATRAVFVEADGRTERPAALVGGDHRAPCAHRLDVPALR